MAITVSFACNDPNNGNFIGRFDRLEVDAGDLHMEFEGDMYRRVFVDFDFAVTNGYGTVKIGRIKVPALAYKSWYGNWCWDAAWFSWVEALKVINYLGTLKYWRIVDGPSDLFEAFNERREITPVEWKFSNEKRTA